MKRIFRFNLRLCILIAFAGSCTHPESPPRESGRIPVAFQVEGSFTPTRIPAAQTPDENRISHWAVFLFQNGNLCYSGTSTTSNSIILPIESGTYTVCALANYPDTFHPDGIRTITELEQTSTTLDENLSGSWLMYGCQTAIPITEARPVTLSVERLLVKVGIRQIRTDFSNHPELQSKTCILQAVFLTNVYNRTHYGYDEAFLQMRSDPELWYNKMGLENNSLTGGFYADTDIRAEINDSRPYNQLHIFYCCPNGVPAEQDTRDANWKKRRTRLVLEMQIGATRCYYPITLADDSGILARNKYYLIDEAVITKMGSLDPEQEIEGSIEVKFNTFTNEWNTEYTIREIS